MLRFVRIPALLLTASAALSLTNLKAQTVVSNFSETVQTNITLSSTIWTSVSFTTDGQAYTLDSVSLDVAVASNTSGNFFVSIYDESNFRPGSLITNGSLTGSDNPTVGTNVYSAAGTVSLAANTAYHIVTGVSSGAGVYAINWTTSTSQTGDWTLGDARANSGNQGSSWSFSSGPLIASVNATAVPEPSSFGLVLGLTAVGFIATRRRPYMRS